MLDFPHYGIFPGKKNPEQYIELREKYLSLVPYLLSGDDMDPQNQLAPSSGYVDIWYGLTCIDISLTDLNLITCLYPLRLAQYLAS